MYVAIHSEGKYHIYFELASLRDQLFACNINSQLLCLQLGETNWLIGRCRGRWIQPKFYFAIFPKREGSGRQATLDDIYSRQKPPYEMEWCVAEAGGLYQGVYPYGIVYREVVFFEISLRNGG
ncbi:hypothetical protein AVEN_41830-1 [Araneus ventricosus]|uniref:Uncharacterized protein n=1 Tax=Araneus ventricosus TaxID=182803 RepID=A0A4Y2ACA2_ARAVE|nr:hypothetical protein AVEN_41830-1 [Araneus ventricosus]